MDWQEAPAYCEDLEWGGFNDWRLPSVVELSSIVDNGVTSPSIDDDAFPETVSSYFWSSSSYTPNASDAWRVNFHYGYVANGAKNYPYYVRCVRGGP